MGLTESLLSTINPNVIASASKYFGESSTSTETGLTVAMSSVLAATSKLAASDGGAGLADLVKAHPVDSGTLGNLATLFSPDANGSSIIGSGQQLLGTLFGPRTTAVTSTIESLTGIRNSSASSMLTMAAPIVMGFLARHQATEGLTAKALATQLVSERDSLARMLPDGVRTALGVAAPLGAKASSRLQSAPLALGFAPAAVATAEPVVHRTRWIIPLAILLGLLAIGAFLVTRMREGPAVPTEAATPTPRTEAPISTTQTPAPTTDASAPSSSTEAPAAREEGPPAAAPAGQSLSLSPDSPGYELVTFLGTGSAAQLPKTFAFDGLNFVFNSTQLTAQSVPTVAALARILNAYPNATVQLSGYTDSIGRPEANKKLSIDRANAVRDQLVSAGVAASRIATQGLGEESPIASNDTDEGRAKNRRLELTVTKM
jgi:outer membrane protein OmpA-like peptidoglycan-associated protein